MVPVSRRKSYLIGLMIVLSGPPAFAAERLFVDSRATNLDPADSICRLNFREIPRQALIVAAEGEFGVGCVDATTEPEAIPHAGDHFLGLGYVGDRERLIIKVSLYDSENHVLKTTEIPHRVNAMYIGDMQEFVAQCDELARSEWQPILIKQLGIQPQPRKWDPKLPAPAECEALLSNMDFTSAFLAARVAQRAIAETGESPARLSALSRAYANLGETTRNLVSGDYEAFFARSLLYAHRLVRLAPNDRISYFTRAYALALYGVPIPAGQDLKHAAAMPEKAPEPRWATLLQHYLKYDTLALVGLTRTADAPLAAYLAWLTVEHSPLKTLNCNFASAALELNPGALRAHHCIIDNTMSEVQHGFVQTSAEILHQTMEKILTVPGIPPPVQQAFIRAQNENYSMDSLKNVASVLGGQPEDPAQSLQWSTYAAMLSDAQFINAVQLLTHLQYADNQNTAPLRDRFLEVLGNHRYADFVRSFGSRAVAPRPDVVAAVQKMNFKDDSLAALPMQLQLNQLQISKDPRRNVYWNTRWRQQSGNEAYDLTYMIWLASLQVPESEYTPQFLEYWRNEARTLESLAPNHPLALTGELIADWKTTEPRAHEIETTSGANPIVAYGLARAYSENGRSDDAIRILSQTIEQIPDVELVTLLANVYASKNDMAGWAATWETYLKTPEDEFHPHENVYEMMATRLLEDRHPELALPYSEKADEQGGIRGAELHVMNLLALRRYDDAAAMSVKYSDRYDFPMFHYRFCRMTGHGDLQAAKAAVANEVREFETSNDPNVVRLVATYFVLDEQPEQAAAMWDRLMKMPKHVTNAMMLAVVCVERDQPAQAIALLKETMARPGGSVEEQAYLAGAAEMLRCISDPNAIPARDGSVGKLITSKSTPAPRGNVCYFLGRLCELRKLNDDAKWWYRASLDCPDITFTTRPLAAMALRRLGEEYYK